ncbi:MAG: hypothetical protein AAB471_02475 [Patescibacteria group bacterium]
MMTFIEKLREKPEHIRKRILYVAVPTITFVIAVLWFFSLGSADLNQTAAVIEVGPAAIIKDDSLNIWTQFKGGIRDVFKTAPPQIPFQ